ncbi:MAG: ABC transporter permease [Gemmatimonadota bacterium]
MPPTFRFPFRSRSRIASEVDEELELHLAMVAAHLRAEGWSPPDAEAEARRRFGDLDFTRAYCRDEDFRREKEKSRMIVVDELRNDVLYALRGLRASPGFALIALATLAFGIGANTAIFSVVRGVLLAPLPFTTPDRVVRVWESNKTLGIAQGTFSEPDFLDVRAESRLASTIGGYFFADGRSGVDLKDGGTPEHLSAALVTPGFFETLKPHPLLGRTLTTEEGTPGRNHSVVIGYGLWKRRFGGDVHVVGRSVTLDGEPFTIVGVLPQEFTYPASQSLDVWMPLSFFGPDAIGRGRASHFVSVIARLNPGVTTAQFQTELAALASRLSSGYPENAGWDAARVTTIRESIVGEVRGPLLVLVAAVALVLLITCVNIASLLLARATARQRELAVRAALGAGRGRIVRQLLTESLIVALLGGMLGALLGYAAVRALVAAGGVQLPRGSELHVDGLVLLCAFAISLISGLLFGAMPAIRAAGPALERKLRTDTRGSVGSGAQAQRLRGALVVSQVALAVVLVVGAGLATKSFARLLSVDPGFHPEHVLVERLSIPEESSDSVRGPAYYASVLDAVRAVPGVEAAGSVRDLPTRGVGEMRRAAQLGLPLANGAADASVQLHHISTDYFKAMGTRLESGRDFQATDRHGAPIVLIVNEELAKRYWPGEGAAGKVLHVGNTDLQIVGVVQNIHQNGLSEPVEPTIYIHALQNLRGAMSIVVRTKGDPMRLANAVRHAIWSVNRNQSLMEVTTMENVLGSAVARQKLLAWLLGIFGVLGLLLGAIGIYGLLSFAVTQRRQEIGVRAALGAPASSVMRMILGQGMALAFGGVIIGTIAASLLTKQLQAQLFGIRPGDPVTFAEVIAVLLGTAMLASWSPARRALAIDPVTAMRQD